MNTKMLHEGASSSAMETAPSGSMACELPLVDDEILTCGGCRARTAK
jgi:hypothetical protein